jgi:hypothetical protein
VPDERLPTLDEWLELHRDDPIVWGDGPHLISVDMLRAMGALDCPPEWRKSLGVPKKGPQQGSLFANLSDDEEEE